MIPHFIWKANLGRLLRWTAQATRPTTLSSGAVLPAEYKTWTHLFTGIAFGRWGFGVLYQKTEKNAP